MEAVIVACITGIVSLLVCLINNNYTQKNIEAKHQTQMDDMMAHNEESIAIIQCSIDEMKRSIDKVSSVTDRIYSIEQRLAVQEERQKVANARISDLENKKE